MTGRRTLGAFRALAAVAAASLLAAGAAAAQRRVVLIGPAERDTLRTITPTFAVTASGFADADRPLTLRVEVAQSPSFAPGTLVADTSVTGDAATVVLSRPLPERVRVWWRAVARTAAGDSVVSDVSGPVVVRDWLVLVSPNARSGTTVNSRRPRFVWSSAHVVSPPGPWVYTFSLFRTADAQPVVVVSGLLDTTFTPAFDLESNVSYRWAVTARLTTGEAVSVSSAATFVVVDPGHPLATLLFQNFPNPFPSRTSAVTCIWFDLRASSLVRLTVTDLRGNPVRTLVPSSDIPTALQGGRYGRAFGSDDNGGCDPRFTWDGVDASGRVVPAGVYLLRLDANGEVFVRKMLFLGK